MISILRLTAFCGLLSLALCQNLNCDFDSGNFCSWTNDGQDNFDWQTGDSVRIDAFHSVPRTVTGTGNFAYAQGQFRPSNRPNAAARLVSPTIPGTTAATELSFIYWKSAAPPALRICTRQEGANQLICIRTISGLQPQMWLQERIVIPADPLQFQIVIEAANFNSMLDLLAIDDVVWNGSFLKFRDADIETRNYYPKQTVPEIPLPEFVGQRGGFKPQQFLKFEDDFGNGSIISDDRISTNVEIRPVPSVPTSLFHKQNHQKPYLITSAPEIPSGACPAVSCSFVYGLCQWFNDVSGNFEWNLKNKGTQFSGIPGDTSGRNSYLYVTGDSGFPNQRASLKSPNFIIPYKAYLEFYAYISDATTGRLAVYKNNPFDSHNLLWTAVGYDHLQGQGWKRVMVPIGENTDAISILFIADSMSQRQFIGIDDVRLAELSGRELGCGADPDTFRKSFSSPFNPQEAHRLLNAFPGQNQNNRLARVPNYPNDVPAVNSDPNIQIPLDLKPAVALGSQKNAEEIPSSIPAGLRPATAWQDRRRIQNRDGNNENSQYASSTLIPKIPNPPIQLPTETITEILKASQNISSTTTSVSTESGDTGWVTVQPLVSPITEDPGSPLENRAELVKLEIDGTQNAKLPSEFDRYLAGVVQGISEELGTLLGLPSPRSQLSKLAAQRSLNPYGAPLADPNADPWNILAALQQSQPGFQAAHAPQLFGPAGVGGPASGLTLWGPQNGVRGPHALSQTGSAGAQPSLASLQRLAAISGLGGPASSQVQTPPAGGLGALAGLFGGGRKKRSLIEKVN